MRQGSRYYRFPTRLRGFTLLEIIIALAISALIGVAAMNLLDEATQANQNVQEKGERYNNIERALLFISRDIQQVALRKFRDEFGDLKNNLTSDDTIGKTHISFTRLGRRNPAGLARSNLEKLSYYVEDKQLIRISYAYPDGMSADAAQIRPLLKNVERMTLSFYDGEEWSDFWPNDSQEEKNDSVELPVAIRFKLELSDIGEIERLFVTSDRIIENNG